MVISPKLWAVVVGCSVIAIVASVLFFPIISNPGPECTSEKPATPTCESNMSTPANTKSNVNQTGFISAPENTTSPTHINASYSANSLPASASHSIRTGTVRDSLFITICGELPFEGGPANTLGTYYHPLTLLRGGQNATVPICIRSGNVNQTLYWFSSIDCSSYVKPPQYGINVYLDKTSSTIRGESVSSYTMLGIQSLSVLDHITVNVNADKDAVPGLHCFLIVSTENGTDLTTQDVIYVNIK